jgi:hypothetical protein
LTSAAAPTRKPAARGEGPAGGIAPDVAVSDQQTRETYRRRQHVQVRACDDVPDDQRIGGPQQVRPDPGGPVGAEHPVGGERDRAER